jgi:predicted flap endonuclease-1-like 5' DNA nuclease
VNELEEALAARETELETLTVEIESLETTPAAEETVAAPLERKKVRDRKAGRETPKEEKQEPRPRSEPSVPRTGRAAAVHAVAERFADDPEDQVDELQEIPGIGDLIAWTLKSMNIRTFRQIASLTPEDIENVEAALNRSPGYIERLNWIEIARTLHREKYGETI